MKARFAWTALAALPLAVGAAAQTVTRIDPDMDPARSLGTSVSSAGPIHAIDGGTRSGANLFHSFARFDLGQGDTARWVHSGGNPSAIANVVNRVTGGTASFIDGTIDSTALPNADFWFINPSGILFGAGARLDVPAAAHFSTASELRFEQGPAFAVATPSGSTFSVAPPAAFGFDAGQGDISIDGAGAGFLPATGQLTLAAREITVFDSAISGSGFHLLAVGAGARELPLAESPPTDLDGFLLILGSALRLSRSPAGPAGIRIGGGVVIVESSDLGTPFTDDGLSAGGPIEIAGSNIEIFSSLVSAASFGAEDSGKIAIRGGDVRIVGNSIVTTDLEFGSTGFSGDIAISGNNLLIEGSRITSSTQTGLPGGAILLEADTINVADGSVVAASGLPTSTSDAGTIFIRSRLLDVGPASAITSSTLGTGSAGAIDIDVTERITLSRSEIGSSSGGPSSGSAGTVMIRTGRLELRDQASISTSTGGPGDAGLIMIDVAGAELDGGSRIESVSTSAATGDAGLVMLQAEGLSLTDGAAIRSDTSGSGAGGGILIQATDVELSDNARISSDSLAMCWSEPCGPSGAAGGVAIIADRLRLFDVASVDGAATISSETRGSGNAGEINLLVGSLEMEGEGAVISSDTAGSGVGGTIRIDADTFVMRQEALLSTGAFGSGRGGTIDIVAGAMLMEQEAAIKAQSSFGNSGDGGSVLIRADSLIMRDVAEINTNTRGNGDAGTIAIEARLIDLDFSYIGSDSIGGGEGGAVSLTADEIRLTGGGTVSSDAIGFCDGFLCDRAGDAGSVTVKARVLTLASADDGLGIRVSGISSQTSTDGDAGDIVVNADEISLNMAEIVSGTEADGAAGTVSVNAGNLSMADGSRISTSSNPFCLDGCASGGDAGNVKIVARESISVETGSEISSNTTGPGGAGQIVIQTGSLFVEQARISSGTTSSGHAGEIVVGADTVRLGFMGEIESLADFGSSGDAGSIAIKAGDIAIDGGSITSSGSGTGRAGTIAMSADAILVDRLGGIASTAGLQAEAPGSIELSAGLIRIDNGSIITSSSGSSGATFGEVRISADRLEMGTLATLTSSTFGAGPGGSVTVVAREVELGMGSEIASRAEEGSTGPGGFVSIVADRLTMQRSFGLSTETFGSGSAGQIFVDAGEIDVDNSMITSSTESQLGASGTVTIFADSLRVRDGGAIRTNSANPNPAGGIMILADAVVVEGPSEIASVNQSELGGAAGMILIETSSLRLAEGGAISTSSLAGAAGDIGIAMPRGSILRLEGDNAPGTITTSSGPGTGGRIIVTNPYAIISDGGSILALGEQGGANVQIQTDFFISSADRPNLVAVDGSFLLEAQVGDMSRGTVDRDLSVLDASGVLRGQCAAVRRTGEVSQLVVRPVGPLGARGEDDMAPSQLGTCI